jgi:hypothetical protein
MSSSLRGLRPLRSIAPSCPLEPNLQRSPRPQAAPKARAPQPNPRAVCPTWEELLGQR